MLHPARPGHCSPAVLPPFPQGTRLAGLSLRNHGQTKLHIPTAATPSARQGSLPYKTRCSLWGQVGGENPKRKTPPTGPQTKDGATPSCPPSSFFCVKLYFALRREDNHLLYSMRIALSPPPTAAGLRVPGRGTRGRRRVAGNSGAPER